MVRVQPEAVAFLSPVPSSPSLPPLVTCTDDSSSSDLWFLVSETSVPPPALLQLLMIPDASFAPAVTPPQSMSSSAMPLDHGDSSQPALSLSPADKPSTIQQSLRRTTHLTAGCHPNVRHLPRPAGSQGHATSLAPGPVSNSQTAVFRP